MSEKKKFAHILGNDFSCRAEPPEKDCPAEKGDVQLNEVTGSYVCPLCLIVVGLQHPDSQQELYDEEDDEDAGPMDEGKEFAPEGDKIQDFTPDFKKQIDRENALDELALQLHPIDQKFAISITRNRKDIIRTLRELEISDHPAFREGVTLRPKIAALAAHFNKLPPPSATMLKVGINPTRVMNLYNLSNRLLSPHKDVQIEMQYLAIGRQLNMPDSLVRASLEEYETKRPIIRTIDPHARIVAWLYVMGIKYGWKITKTNLIKLSGAKRNATREAIKEYTNYLSNIKEARENPSPHGLKRESHMA